MATPLSEKLLDVQSLACGYPNRIVLKNLDFSVQRNEVVALLGSNGSGKSTLLKTIARLLRKHHGKIQIEGVEIELESLRKTARRVSYVPQVEDHIFEYSVAEVVALGRIPWSDGIFETSDDWKMIQTAMVSADCDYLQHRSVLELSGGEKQRVLIARALAQETPLMLLDEPTSHLDVKHQVEVGMLLGRLAQDQRGILVAVHDLNWAAAHTHRALLLHHGELVFDGLSETLFQSKIVEDVYGVTFDRFDIGNNQHRVFPALSN